MCVCVPHDSYYFHLLSISHPFFPSFTALRVLPITAFFAASLRLQLAMAAMADSAGSQRRPGKNTQHLVHPADPMEDG